MFRKRCLKDLAGAFLFSRILCRRFYRCVLNTVGPRASHSGARQLTAHRRFFFVLVVLLTSLLDRIIITE